MTARGKRNQVYVDACLLVAAAVGLIAPSWPAFVAALVVLVGVCCADGAIRPRGGRG